VNEIRIKKTLFTAIEADEMISHVDLRYGVASLHRLERHQRRSNSLILFAPGPNTSASRI
jgi:hypothetical protein